jgi:hypothetical protein
LGNDVEATSAVRSSLQRPEPLHRRLPSRAASH